VAGGSGKYVDLLEAARLGAKGMANTTAGGFLVVTGDGDKQIPG
jgi:hypothetical protein